MLKNMLQMKDWQTGNKKLKIMTKIAYSERLVLEGQQELNTWWYSPKFSSKTTKLVWLQYLLAVCRKTAKIMFKNFPVYNSV